MRTSFGLCCLLFASLSAQAAEWPQWRGPDGQGHSPATGLPLHWSDSENVAWKADIPGKGHSSPVIDGNQIWLTTAIATLASEEDKKRRLANNTGSQPLTVVDQLSMRAVCVDRATGKVLHDIELMTEPKPDPTHTLNTFASPSPIIEDGKLYCHFGTNGTACLDTQTGKVLWTNRELRIAHENGAGSTPVLFQNLLIVHCDGSDVQYIVALDKQTGEVVWKTDRSGKMNDNPQLKKAYGTPLIVEVAGKPVVISPAADWVYGYDPTTGEELWKVNYGVLGFSIVPRPVAGHGMVYMCTTFMRPEILALEFQDGIPQIAWRFNRQAPNMPSPLIVGDEIYLMSDKGIASCLDAKTGKLHWQERISGNFSASPLYADGRIHFFSREGVTTIIEPGTTFKQLAQNKIDGALMASPPAVDGALFLRTEGALYCVK